MYTTKQNIVSKILYSGNFDRRGFANEYHLHGRDSDETIDNIELHLESMDDESLSMMYEANCPEEVANREYEARGLQPYQMA